MLSKSALTSKRRKVQNHWWELKEDVVTQFTKLFTSAQFLKASDELCNTFCIGCRIEGWEDEIRQTISSVQTGIPSPSNMKWEDIPHVLFESIPKFKNIDDLPNVMIPRKRTWSHNTIPQMKWYRRYWMAMHLRVSAVLLFFRNCKDYLIEITTTDEGKCIMVEIKKTFCKLQSECERWRSCPGFETSIDCNRKYETKWCNICTHQFNRKLY